MIINEYFFDLIFVDILGLLMKWLKGGCLIG